ncbi:hypothetical protein CAEBREN_13323 [Caenorhabditis brenneri]|uniref:Uncharacterized protein n=1 Tax=Caenorhabditis brenneri TaxID=135651 RepID=G0NM17_CAEBE|nr:hypothetical protein CAEBREN_13323 [Caenorhabditis brenneri]
MRRLTPDSEALIPQDPIRKLTSKQKKQLNINAAFHLIGDTLFIIAFCYFCYYLPPMYSNSETLSIGSSIQSIPTPEFSILHYIVIATGLVIRLYIFSLTVYITYEINNGSFEAAKRARYSSYYLYLKAVGPLVSDILFAPGLYWMIDRYGLYPVTGYCLFAFELLYYLMSPLACSIHELLYEFLMSDEERAEREARFDPLMAKRLDEALRSIGLA